MPNIVDFKVFVADEERGVIVRDDAGQLWEGKWYLREATDADLEGDPDLELGEELEDFEWSPLPPLPEAV